MEDFNFWWYILAAIIYFFTRGKKKKGQPTSRPGSSGKPKERPKSFEDLLREITEGRQETQQPTFDQEPVVIEEQAEEVPQRLEGEYRTFADDESRRIYEQSVKMAEGTELESEQDVPIQEKRLFKDPSEEVVYTFADEIRDGLSSEEARKAIIYSEILARKY